MALSQNRKVLKGLIFAVLFVFLLSTLLVSFMYIGTVMAPGDSSEEAKTESGTVFSGSTTGNELLSGEIGIERY